TFGDAPVASVLLSYWFLSASWFHRTPVSIVATTMYWPAQPFAIALAVPILSNAQFAWFGVRSDLSPGLISSGFCLNTFSPSINSISDDPTPCLGGYPHYSSTWSKLYIA
ncbi:unnamed protein product, partial [Allacma fusca]